MSSANVALSSKSNLIKTLSQNIGNRVSKAGESCSEEIASQVALLALRIFNSSHLHKETMQKVLKDRRITLSEDIELENLKQQLQALFDRDKRETFSLIYEVFYQFFKSPDEGDETQEYAQLFYDLFHHLRETAMKELDKTPLEEAEKKQQARVVHDGHSSSTALDELILLFHSALLFEATQSPAGHDLKDELDKVASSNILRRIIARFSEKKQEISRGIKSKVKNNETADKLLKLCQYAFSILFFERLKACSSQAVGRVKDLYVKLKDKHSFLFYLEFRVKRVYKESISPVISSPYFLNSFKVALILYIVYSIYSDNKRLDKINSQILDILTLFFIFQSLNKGLKWLMRRVKTPEFQDWVQKNYDWAVEKCPGAKGKPSKDYEASHSLNNLKDRYYSLI